MNTHAHKILMLFIFISYLSAFSVSCSPRDEAKLQAVSTPPQAGSPMSASPPQEQAAAQLGAAKENTDEAVPSPDAGQRAEAEVLFSQMPDSQPEASNDALPYPRCVVPHTLDATPIDQMRPMILTFETFRRDAWVRIKGNIEVGGEDYRLDFEFSCDGRTWKHMDGSNLRSPRSHFSISCFYKKRGRYTVRLRGHIPSITIPVDGYEYNDYADARYKLHSLDQWGDTRWKSMERFLDEYGFTNHIRAKDAPNLSDVCTMERMFGQDSVIESSIENWDVSHVENMSLSFRRAKMNQDLSRWDISSLRDASYMLPNDCDKCDAFRSKLFHESIGRPKEFAFVMDDYDTELAKCRQLHGTAHIPSTHAPISSSSSKEKIQQCTADTTSDIYQPEPLDNMRPLILTYKTKKDNVWAFVYIDSLDRDQYRLDYEKSCDDGPWVRTNTSTLVENKLGNMMADACLFKKAGLHTIKFRGHIPNINIGVCVNSERLPYDVVSLDQWGDTAWKSMGLFFNPLDYTPKSVRIKAKDAPNLSEAWNMYSMFWPDTIIESSIEDWDTSHIENMVELLMSCKIDQDLSRWDISSLRRANPILSGTDCPKCEAFKRKLYLESLQRPKGFSLSLDNSFIEEQAAKLAKEQKNKPSAAASSHAQ